MKHIIYIILLFSMLNTKGNTQISTAQLYVIITNIPNTNGQIVVALHNSEIGFPKKPMTKLYGEISNGTSTVTFEDIDFGDYAITVIHDENGNGKMDFNLLHIPKEDAAASNNAKGFMGPPKYSDALIVVAEQKRLETIQLTKDHSSLN